MNSREKEDHIAFKEEHWQKLNYTTGCFERRFANSNENYRNADLEKQRASVLRKKSLLNLEKLLVDFETHFVENGGLVLWARDADDAQQMIWDLIIKNGVKSVSRSNSTVLDEIQLNDFLAERKMPVYETSVARFVLQAAGQAPYHPISPMLHLSKEEINGILYKNYKLKVESTPKQIVNFIRHQVSLNVEEAKMCITGANFLLSDVGGVALTENEGNIIKASSAAKIHVVVAGIAKVIPSIEDLSILFPLSSNHATGHPMASVNTITTGPSKQNDGPQQMIVILLNNGRTNILENEKQRQALACIHCGACTSVCPIFKNIGGYSYNSTYIGPIGTVMTPLLDGIENHKEMTTLCALCGRCSEVCPVNIPINDLTIENRSIIATERIGDAKFEALVKAMIAHCKSRKKLDLPIWLKKFEIKQLVSKNDFVLRQMPELAPKSFSQIYKESL